jgi:tetratricopeptide (TPR) repeat protein
LRARLLFDGGYYRRSLAELAGRPIAQFPTFSDQLEFTYRLARVYDKLGMAGQAEKHYAQTVRNGEAHTFYFAANAALHVGRLHESAGRRDEAIRWYRRCLAMRNHEYQDSIDQRAEAGLNRLGAQE